MKSNFDWRRLLERSIEAVYLITIFLIPLIFAWLFPNVNVFELNKTIYFRTSLSLLLFLSLGRYLLFGAKQINFRARHYLAVGALMVFLLLTLIWSPDRGLSFFGLYDRQEGVLSYLFFFLWFFLLVYNFSYGDFRRKFDFVAGAITASAGLVSLYAWLQMMAFDPIRWSEPAFITGRATSTLGQPNFLGSFLLLTWPLTLYLLGRFRQRWWRILGGLVLFLQLGAIYFTASRSAWLGLFLALALMVAWTWNQCRQRGWLTVKRTYVGLAVVILVSVGFLVLLFNGQNNFSERLRSAFDWKKGSVSSRLIFWRDSLSSIYRQPLQGYGLENQESVLIKYYERDWGINGYVNARTNRAHNFILDLALAGGIILAGLYVWMLIEIYLLLDQQRQVNRGAKYLILALAGYFVSLLFGFSFVAGQLYFWLYLALAAGFYENRNHKPEIVFGSGKLHQQWRLSFWLFLFPFLLLGVKLQLSTLTADCYFYAVRDNFNSGRYEEAAEYYERLRILPILQPSHYRDRYISLWYEAIFDGPAEKSRRLFAAQFAGVSIDDQDYFSLVANAKLQALKGNYPLAEDLFLQAIDYTPSLPENYLALSRLYLYQGKTEEAKIYLEEARRLVPDSHDPRLNEWHRQDVSRYLSTLEYYLGEADVKQKNYLAARGYYQEAIRHNYDLRLYKKIADTYYLEGNFDQALWFNFRAMYLDKENYIWPLAISYLYQELGNSRLFQEYRHLAEELNNKK